MQKADAIARRVLGWKLNRVDWWFDYEKNAFIHATDFQPEEHLEHAQLIVERLVKFGFTYSTNGVSEVRFNDVRGTGNTLAQAITNAAYALVEKSSVVDSSRIWQKMC